MGTYKLGFKPRLAGLSGGTLLAALLATTSVCVSEIIPNGSLQLGSVRERHLTESHDHYHDVEGHRHLKNDHDQNHEHEHGHGFDHEGHHEPFGHHEEHNGGSMKLIATEEEAVIPVSKLEGEEATPVPGEGRVHQHPPACTIEDSHSAVEATKTFVTCSGMDYADFIAVVQADTSLLDHSVGCFANVFVDAQAGDEEATKVDFEKCIKELETLDETAPTAATAALLHKMLGSESEMCNCLPDYVEAMPFCEQWARFKHLGRRLSALCGYLGSPAGVGILPPVIEQGNNTVALEEEKEVEVVVESTEEGNEEALVPSKATIVTEVTEKSSSHEPHIPDAYPPCPPGEDGHGASNIECHPSTTVSEKVDSWKREDAWGSEESKERPPPAGGFMGMVVMVAGVALVLFGGIYGWRRYKNRDQQPRVRYMGMAGGDDMGTELGPFGNDYA